MIEAPIPANETERLAALYSLHILDTPAEERFDRVTRLALQLFNVPIAYVSILDANRQWFKSACGIDRGQTDRAISFCGHAIMQNEPLIIPDALLDDRFYDNPLVTDDPKLRFYAGCPLQTASGHKVATLCIGDRCPREFAVEQINVLKALAAIAEDQINLIDSVNLQTQLVDAQHELQRMNDFIRKALGCYATEEVAASVVSNSGKLELGGQKRPVTILLSDLRGFTPFSEKFPPETVVEVLNRYLDVMVDIILKHGGIIDSFIGDGILVIFDSLRFPDHATRAVECAIEMQRAMCNVNRFNLEHGVGEIEMGIGINTGDAVVGNIGSQKRMKYSVIGQTVNLAARIESLTIGGQILISDSTRAQVCDRARIDGRLRVKVKGMAQPIEIFEIGAMCATGANSTASPVAA
jgi:adenylate cyclase